jgi:hypothetical protein
MAIEHEVAIKPDIMFAEHDGVKLFGAGHFWSVDPVEEPGSFGSYAGPRVLRFLTGALPAEGTG